MEIERFGRHITVENRMKKVFDIAKKVAVTNASVLILGETGTGKELMAEAIYMHSLRAQSNMISINCASLPESLIESELFGYVKGAFTDANKNYAGKFEQADGGTLFLDEIGDMPLKAQSKILRVIDRKVVTRIGDTKLRPIDIRIISATNKNLAQEVELGNFRRDLFYRLNEVSVNLVPLREREEDLHLLIEEIINELNSLLGKKCKGISVAALSLFEKHSWPGNIRELRNVIKRAMLLTDSDQIWVENLPISFSGLSSSSEFLKEDIINDLGLESDEFPSLAELEKKYIKKVLEHTKGNRKKAIEILKIGRTTLYDKIKKHNLF